MGTSLPIFNPHAAGIDIGDTMHCVGIKDGHGGHEVKNTSTFTCNLHEIVTTNIEQATGERSKPKRKGKKNQFNFSASTYLKEIVGVDLTLNTKTTGGKITSSKLMKKKNKAGQYLRQAASSLNANKSPIGDYYRRTRGKLGGRGAILNTAHKLSRIIYTMMKNNTEYSLELINDNQERYKEDKIKKLEKQLARLNTGHKLLITYSIGN